MRIYDLELRIMFATVAFTYANLGVREDEWNENSTNCNLHGDWNPNKFVMHRLSFVSLYAFSFFLYCLYALIYPLYGTLV